MTLFFLHFPVFYISKTVLGLKKKLDTAVFNFLNALKNHAVSDTWSYHQNDLETKGYYIF